MVHFEFSFDIRSLVGQLAALIYTVYLHLN